MESSSSIVHKKPILQQVGDRSPMYRGFLGNRRPVGVATLAAEASGHANSQSQPAAHFQSSSSINSSSHDHGLPSFLTACEGEERSQQQQQQQKQAGSGGKKKRATRADAVMASTRKVMLVLIFIVVGFMMGSSSFRLVLRRRLTYNSAAGTLASKEEGLGLDDSRGGSGSSSKVGRRGWTMDNADVTDSITAATETTLPLPPAAFASAFPSSTTATPTAASTTTITAGNAETGAATTAAGSAGAGASAAAAAAALSTILPFPGHRPVEELKAEKVRGGGEREEGEGRRMLSRTRAHEGYDASGKDESF